jgi:DNA-directed RNA polymerase specialized sigma24 family protein
LTDVWLPLKPVHTRQYRTVNLCDGIKKTRRYVHLIVMEAFVGLRPEGMACCHNDGDPENNRIENLRWDTYQANEDDKLRHGTRLMGSQINAKLTEEQVQEIRRLRGEGTTFAELARRFGVSPQNVEKIVHRRSWRHVP